MIEQLQAEIDFLKANKLDGKLWKESVLHLIKRLTSEINVKTAAQKRKLMEEVRDFLAKGKGNDDSFDFVYQEDEKFFKEVHIYRYKGKVVARIDRTIVDENGKHKPFENFIKIEYEENGDEELKAKNISIFGTEYTPFPANLIFAETMFSHIAGDIIEGVDNDKDHYTEMESKTISSIPDIFPTAEHKQKTGIIAEAKKYKDAHGKHVKLAGKNIAKEDLEHNLLFDALRAVLKDSDIQEASTAGLTEEEIFMNLTNKVTARNSLEQRKLEQEARDFFDPNYGDDSFDMTTPVANGSLIYNISKNHQTNGIKAKIRFKRESDTPKEGDTPVKYTGKVKYVHYFDVIRMAYEEDPANPGQFKLARMLILGKVYPVNAEWEQLGQKFYGYLMHELANNDSNHVDMDNIDEVLDILESQYQTAHYVSEVTLEERGVLTDNKHESKREYARRMDKEQDIRIKKKYESLYNMQLSMN